MVIGLHPKEWPLLPCQELPLFLPKIWLSGDRQLHKGAWCFGAMGYCLAPMNFFSIWFGNKRELRVFGFQGQSRQLRVYVRILSLVILVSS